MDEPTARLQLERCEVNEIASLRKLHAAVDEIVMAMKPEDFPGAINWGDLGCYSVALCVDEDGRVELSVVIAESDPSETAFRFHVADQLRARGWGDVAVDTEW